jgi:hypothetical protein
MASPIGPFNSARFRETYFVVSLLDEQDRVRWAVVPNKRGTGFVFPSILDVDAWLNSNGFLDDVIALTAQKEGE